MTITKNQEGAYHVVGENVEYKGTLEEAQLTRDEAQEAYFNAQRVLTDMEIIVDAIANYVEPKEETTSEATTPQE